MAKQQINLSNALAFEVMIIPDIDINNPSKFRSDLRYFSRLTRKFSLIYLLWKPKFPKSIFNSMAFFTKLSTDRKVFPKHNFDKDIKCRKLLSKFFFHFAIIKLSFPKRDKVHLCTKQEKNDLQTLRAWIIQNCS